MIKTITTMMLIWVTSTVVAGVPGTRAKIDTETGKGSPGWQQMAEIARHACVHGDGLQQYLINGKWPKPIDCNDKSTSRDRFIERRVS